MPYPVVFIRFLRPFFIQQKTLKETLCCSFKVAEKVEEVNFSQSTSDIIIAFLRKLREKKEKICHR